MMTRGLAFLILAQFVSGLADSALLIVAMARMAELARAAWLSPLLKLVFTIAYVLLAPMVGALADRWPKAQVMLAANLLKACGCAGMVYGLDPLMAFMLAGTGAALYSPAKYGLVVELVPPAQLVQANGWLEVTTVGAIILGTMLGGALLNPALLQSPLAQLATHATPIRTAGLAFSMLMVLGLYLAAGLLNLRIPHSHASYARVPLTIGPLLQDFVRANRVLWRDPWGAMSLSVTTLFWGAGATLQFVVLAWAQEFLGLSLERAAYLQGITAIGIALGAWAAGRYVTLQQAPRVVWMGVLMGLAVPLMLLVQSVSVAAPLLAAVGALAGFFVVPMNALLQHRGQQLLRSGESIAIQNFSENACVLLMIGAYSGLLAAGWPLAWLVMALGAFVALGVASVMWRNRRNHAPVP